MKGFASVEIMLLSFVLFVLFYTLVSPINDMVKSASDDLKTSEALKRFLVDVKEIVESFGEGNVFVPMDLNMSWKGSTIRATSKDVNIDIDVFVPLAEGNASLREGSATIRITGSGGNLTMEVVQ